TAQVGRQAGRVVDDGTAGPHSHVPQSAEVQRVVVQTCPVGVCDATHSLEQDRVLALQVVVAGAGSQGIGTRRRLELMSVPTDGRQGPPNLPVAPLEDEMPYFQEIPRTSGDRLFPDESIPGGSWLGAGTPASHPNDDQEQEHTSEGGRRFAHRSSPFWN